MVVVSVVVPAYNAEKNLRNAISSLLNQTLRNIEVIIVDDGSIDNTEEIANSIEKSDNRVKCIHINNLGVSNARNIALNNCTGKYIAFLDSDDTMQLTMLEQLVNAIEHDDDIDMACCGFNVVDINDKVRFSKCPKTIICNNNELFKGIGYLQQEDAFNVIWNKLFKRDIIEKYCIRMDTSISMGEDLLFVIEYLKNTKGKINILDKALYNYKLSSNGLQASEGNKVDLNYRINQINKLKKIYIYKGYPLDSMYKEILSCFYMSIRDSKDIKLTLISINESDAFNEIKNINCKFGIKYSLLLVLLKLNNVFLIKLFFKVFQIIKKVFGKSYNWN